MARDEIKEAVGRLDDVTRHLRAECPWDREQDERSIVPHTVEEAYELADAANRGDDAKLLDELGDVLFQVHFLSLLMEERGAGTLADVAEHCRQKLIRRHPHVYGEAEAADRRRGPRELGPDQGRARRAASRGSSARSPRTSRRSLYARKLIRRARSAERRRTARPTTSHAAADGRLGLRLGRRPPLRRRRARRGG